MINLITKIMVVSSIIVSCSAQPQKSTLDQELNKAHQLIHNGLAWAVNELENAHGMTQKFKALETVVAIDNEQEVDNSEKYDYMFTKTLKNVCNLEYKTDQMIKILQEEFLSLPIGTQEEKYVKLMLNTLKRTWYNLLECKVLYDVYHNYHDTQRILAKSPFLIDAELLRHCSTIQQKYTRLITLVMNSYGEGSVYNLSFQNASPFLRYKEALRNEITELLHKLTYFENAKFKLSTPAASNDFESDMFEFTQHLKTSITSLKKLDDLISQYIAIEINNTQR